MEIIGTDTNISKFNEVCEEYQELISWLVIYIEKLKHANEDEVITCPYCGSILKVDIEDWEISYYDSALTVKCPKCGRTLYKKFKENPTTPNISKSAMDECKKVLDLMNSLYKTPDDPTMNTDQNKQLEIMRNNLIKTLQGE